MYRLYTTQVNPLNISVYSLEINTLFDINAAVQYFTHCSLVIIENKSHFMTSANKYCIARCTFTIQKHCCVIIEDEILTLALSVNFFMSSGWYKPVLK